MDDYQNHRKMLWWKQLESAQEFVMMIEMEEQRKEEYINNTTVTLTLPIPVRDPVLQDNLLIANLEQVKSLQATLFPICNKGKKTGFVQQKGFLAIRFRLNNLIRGEQTFQFTFDKD